MAIQVHYAGQFYLVIKPVIRIKPSANHVGRGEKAWVELVFSGESRVDFVLRANHVNVTRFAQILAKCGFGKCGPAEERIKAGTDEKDTKFWHIKIFLLNVKICTQFFFAISQILKKSLPHRNN